MEYFAAESTVCHIPTDSSHLFNMNVFKFSSFHTVTSVTELVHRGGGWLRGVGVVGRK